MIGALLKIEQAATKGDWKASAWWKPYEVFYMGI